MKDHVNLHLSNAEKMAFAGHSLASSLYGSALTILCTGPLGAGKTTFIKGLAEGLGCKQPVTSPTFALEQRYKGDKGTLIHLDLYRLAEKDAQSLAHALEEEGIVCIEWSERLQERLPSGPRIRADFTEEKDGRRLTLTFEDLPFPTREDVLAWRELVHLPPHVSAHCDRVATVSDALTADMLARGIICRPLAVHRACELHDLLRFIDFRTPAGPGGWKPKEEDLQTWEDCRKQYEGKSHEQACAAFLQERGYDHLADIIEPHGLNMAAESRKTIEQKLVYYADKRVLMDKQVTVRERFEDFIVRYGGGKESAQSKRWLEETLAIENELFPSAPPV